MLADRIEGKWIDPFCEIFASCAVKPGDTAAILSETQSRALNVELAEARSAAARRAAVSHRRAHTAQPPPRSGALDRRQRGDRQARSRDLGAGPVRVRRRLFSTGANEFAGRYTAGHFDIPVMKTTITIDNTVVVREGVLQDVFG